LLFVTNNKRVDNSIFINKLNKKMKRLILLFLMATLLTSCNNNPDYAKNLATAQKLFQLHEEENLEAQLAPVSEKMESITSMYGGEATGFDQYKAMIKGYHNDFDDIKYNANVWLPGTDPDGILDGSVRTYGTWTGTNVATGKQLNLMGYWYFNFDAEGKVITQGDFFDYGGMYNAVYPKTKVFATIEIKEGKASEIMALLNSEGGLAATRAYEGCMSTEMVYNSETNTIWIVEDWASNDLFLKYIEWRQTADEYKIIEKMIPYMKEGAKGLTVAHSNSNYTAY
jgi:quinol monooxygenase YgiN